MGKIIQLTLPIGNLEDITLRVRNALNEGEVFLAEDTRVFKSFCQQLGVSLQDKTILSYHDHSGTGKLNSILERYNSQDIYIVSDAGSPYISDPAYLLIREALLQGFEIESYPGATSVITALELSGLPAIPFHFHGFLARDKTKKNNFYQMLQNVPGTHIFFEGVSRVQATIEELAQKFPLAEVVVARELTKKFQEVLRFNGALWIEHVKDLTLKGEFVVLIHLPQAEAITSSTASVELAQEIIEKGPHPKKLSKLLAELTGQNAKEIYAKLTSK